MTTNLDSPIVFISYCWTPVTNKNWVLSIAERLMRDGVIIIIDEWDAKEGQDKFGFMEQMVNRKDVSYVLMICNKDYADKANKKKGGVGIESQIISSEVYNKVDQQKFIPIVREYDDSRDAYLPTFLKSRFFIDLCDGDAYEDNYERLLRRLFNKPRQSKPPVGKPPSYLTSEAPIYLNTANKTYPLKDSILNGKSSTHGLIQDYFEAFFESVVDLKLSEIKDPNHPPIDELMLEKLIPLKLLRDEYLDIISLILKHNNIDGEGLFQFFENFANKVNKGISDPYYDYNNHIQLFLNEIFLYTCAILIKHEKFELLSTLLLRNYPIERNPGQVDFESYSTTFNEHCQYFDKYRNSRLQLNRVSVSADILIERVTNKLINSDELIETDVFLHYISLLNNIQVWFPRLSIYRRFWKTPIFIQKMQSKRFFEKIKVAFNISTVQELQQKILKLDQNIYNGYGFNYSFPRIFNAFDIDKINKLN